MGSKVQAELGNAVGEFLRPERWTRPAPSEGLREGGAALRRDSRRLGSTANIEFTGSSHPWNLVSSFLSEEQSSPEQKAGRGSWLVSDVPFPHTRSVPGFCAAL